MYIALDTETGGLSKESSLLTAFFLVLDDYLDEVESLYLEIKPNNGLYTVEAQGLGINGINIVQHDQSAVYSSKAGIILRDFLIKHSSDGKSKLIPIGHNIYYDLDKIDSSLINRKEYEKYISYRLLDTGVLAQAFRVAGLVPSHLLGSLTELAAFYNIPAVNMHNAESDTRVTVEILRRQLQVLCGRN